MAITIDQVVRVLDAKALNYRRIDNEHVMLGLQGDVVDLQIVISLEETGRYLSVQTHGLAELRKNHPRFEEVLTLLAHANERFKLTKFGWNGADGEISIETSLLLEDNPELTSGQVQRLIGIFPPVCRQVWPKVEAALSGVAPSGPVMPSRRMRAMRPTQEVRVRHNPALWILAMGVLLLGVAALIVALKFTS